MVIVTAPFLATVLGCGGDAGSPAEPAGPPATATAAASSPLVFRQVSAGSEHTCGVTTDNKAYCWGRNDSGELGRAPYEPDICEEGFFACSRRPVAVAGGVLFQNVSAGAAFSCGVATDARAWCWGNNGVGQLGDGTTTSPLKPVAVKGGHLFRQVTTGDSHACGLTTDDRIYCWGANYAGQLGDGTQATRLVPVAVAGGRTWQLVSAGGGFTCALTMDNQAFCWGENTLGELGDSSTATQRLVPVRVAGGRRFKQLSSGAGHTCAVTFGAEAFCWGFGESGQLGNGRTANARWPKAVAGGLAIDRITGGSFHTCARTFGNKAYCWGRNDDGQLGIGTPSGPNVCPLSQCSTRPVAVAGGLSFVQVDAGGLHTCARDKSNLAYCWGDNFLLQSGGGPEFGRTVLAPAPVHGPL
jgi:alpha-tubulin suppressor-like RCC1 family protein